MWVDYDKDGLLGGVVALAPNIHAPGVTASRPLYDYTTEAALLLPCALSDARFDAVAFARVQGKAAPAWLARCASLHEHGLGWVVAPRRTQTGMWYLRKPCIIT